MLMKNVTRAGVTRYDQTPIDPMDHLQSKLTGITTIDNDTLKIEYICTAHRFF